MAQIASSINFFAVQVLQLLRDAVDATLLLWWGRRDLNPQSCHGPASKAGASSNFATPPHGAGKHENAPGFAVCTALEVALGFCISFPCSPSCRGTQSRELLVSRSVAEDEQ
jgi:hypothetical protein